jgi:hypothetical protein
MYQSMDFRKQCICRVLMQDALMRPCMGQQLQQTCFWLMFGKTEQETILGYKVAAALPGQCNQLRRVA